MTDQSAAQDPKRLDYADQSPLTTGELIEVKPSRWSEYFAAIKHISPTRDLQNFTKMPCAASSMLMGLLTGGSVFGITFLTGKPLPAAMRWGVSGFAFVSIAMHYQCEKDRIQEKERMQFIVDQLNKATEGKRNIPSGHNVHAGSRNTGE